jgi:hypothetical protein
MRNSAKPAIAGLPGYSRIHAACATGNGAEMRALHVFRAFFQSKTMPHVLVLQKAVCGAPFLLYSIRHGGEHEHV